MEQPALAPREREVLDRIRLEDIVELTASLIATPGENPPGDEGRRAALLHQACAVRGFDSRLTEVEPGRPNVSAVLAGGDGPGLLLLGHTDVVPVGAGWTVDPLSAETRDGRLYGRGSSDMLGGLAACVVAMSALRAAGVERSGPIELAAVVDEEETGKGIRHYLAAADRSHFCGCIVAEPTDLQTVIAARGDSYVEFAFEGRAAHSGRPSEGVNAIYAAATVVSDLQRWNDELAAYAHPLVGPATWSVGLISGGTGTSIVPARCTVMADRRLLPQETGGEVIEQVNRRVKALDLAGQGAALKVRPTMEMPGFETLPDERLVQVTDAALRAVGGPGLPLGGWTAACDGGFVSRDAGVPVVVLGPGSVAAQAHQADESVALEELVVAARAYALAAMRLLG